MKGLSDFYIDTILNTTDRNAYNRISGEPSQKPENFETLAVEERQFPTTSAGSESSLSDLDFLKDINKYNRTSGKPSQKSAKFETLAAEESSFPTTSARSESSSYLDFIQEKDHSATSSSCKVRRVRMDERKVRKGNSILEISPSDAESHLTEYPSELVPICSEQHTSVEEQQLLDRNNPKLPAWIFCTRYSDRPCSGPRARRRHVGQRVSSSYDSEHKRRQRIMFNAEQLTLLEKEFSDCRYLTEKRRQTLSNNLDLEPMQIKVWFQNKRAKYKKTNKARNRLAVDLKAQGLYNHKTEEE